jgi:pyruvate,water dikinase
MIFAMIRRVRASIKRLPAFLAQAPARCDALLAQIDGVRRAQDLAPLWRDDIEPFFREACHMQQAAGRQDSGALVHMFQELRECMGEADANTLTTGLHTGAGELASMGPLIGLGRLARGEIDQATFARRYGHRSPHEFEVSMPRPAEDPMWIERQLAQLNGAAVDPTALLARQEAARAEAWRRLGGRFYND